MFNILFKILTPVRNVRRKFINIIINIGNNISSEFFIMIRYIKKVIVSRYTNAKLTIFIIGQKQKKKLSAAIPIIKTKTNEIIILKFNIVIYKRDFPV